MNPFEFSGREQLYRYNFLKHNPLENTNQVCIIFGMSQLEFPKAIYHKTNKIITTCHYISMGILCLFFNNMGHGNQVKKVTRDDHGFLVFDTVRRTWLVIVILM